ncbi:hypothetical protein [Streptomyces sp. NPDC054794]
MAVLVIEEFLSPGKRIDRGGKGLAGAPYPNLNSAAFWAHSTCHPFSGGPIGGFSIPDPSREQFKYSSTRTPSEAVFRLDNAGILANSRLFFRAFSGGATQGVVARDLHDRFQGACGAPATWGIEYMRE